MEPSVNVIIPTYNREHLIRRSVEAALGQSYHHLIVTVIDDASSDNTRSILEPWFSCPNFNYIQLGRNIGTAEAKNVGLALSVADAYSFHDSDDIPHRDKVLIQARVIGNTRIQADPCLNWKLSGHKPETFVDVGCVLSWHDLVLPDGQRVEIRRTLSLVDDFFPNLQMGASIPGDWTLVNSGLFRASVFERLGGFARCIEEDREFRNRLIMAGEVIWVVPEPLLTKIETPDSLTQSPVSDYDSVKRRSDRLDVWKRVEVWHSDGTVPVEPIDLANLDITFVSNPVLLGQTGALLTPATRLWATKMLLRWGGRVSDMSTDSNTALRS